MSKEEYIRQTFEELGLKSFKIVQKETMLVRTHPLPDKTPGGIYIPAKLASFHGELPNQQPIVGTILSKGKQVTLDIGEDVCFLRLHFNWLYKMEDGTFVGLIAEPNLLGGAEGEGYVTIRH